MKKVIAITGKIGSGKSSIGKILKKDFKVFSIDQIQRQMYQEEGLLKKLLISNHPQFIKNDKVDFLAIKNELINNKQFKTEYQKAVVDVLIPIIKEITNQNNEIIFIEIPYINSQRLAAIFDQIILVKADKEIRIKRVMARDKTNFGDTKKWVEASVKNIDFDNYFIIENNDSLEILETKTKEIIKWASL